VVASFHRQRRSPVRDADKPVRQPDGLSCLPARLSLPKSPNDSLQCPSASAACAAQRKDGAKTYALETAGLNAGAGEEPEEEEAPILSGSDAGIIDSFFALTCRFTLETVLPFLLCVLNL
jgi:hypothetical protein